MMGVVVAGGMAAPARAQERFSATVSSVVDGDTVRAQIVGGPALEVQLIGIDTPELMSVEGRRPLITWSGSRSGLTSRW